MLFLLLQHKMKNLYLLTVLLVAFLAISCKHKSEPAKPAATPAKVVVTADVSAGARVVSVNTVGRFVVLSFPNGDLPRVQHPMFLYRAGLKVAAIKITGTFRQRDNSSGATDEDGLSVFITYFLILILILILISFLILYFSL